MGDRSTNCHFMGWALGFEAWGTVVGLGHELVGFASLLAPIPAMDRVAQTVCDPAPTRN